MKEQSRFYKIKFYIFLEGKFFFTATLPLLLLKFGAVPPQIFCRYQDFKNATFEKSSGEKRYLATVVHTVCCTLLPDYFDLAATY